MAKIYESGHYLAFAFRTIRFCIVVVVVGPICHNTSADPSAVDVTPVYRLAASPVWMDGSVYFVDGIQRMMIRYQSNTGTIDTVKLHASADLRFLVPISNKTKFAVGFGNGVGVFAWNGTSDSPITAENYLTITEFPGEVVECGKADHGARLWVGTSYPGNGPNRRGRLYLVDVNGIVTQKLDDKGVPGGIAWSADDTWLFYSDTTDRIIVGYIFNKDKGDVGTSVVVFDFAAQDVLGIPNDLTVDKADTMWVACKDSPHVVQIDRTSYTVLQDVHFPETSAITSLVFGSLTLEDLYVTTAANADPKFKKSGSLFHVTNTGSIGIDVFRIDVNWPKKAPPPAT